MMTLMTCAAIRQGCKNRHPKRGTPTVLIIHSLATSCPEQLVLILRFMYCKST